MYNESQKAKYIDYCVETSTIKNKEKYRANMVSFFCRLSEDVEEKYDKDFCELSYEEIKGALSIFCKKTASYQKANLSKLRAYINWCIDSGLTKDFENKLEGISVSNIDSTISCRMNMVANEDQLSQYFDIFLQSPSLNTVDNMYRVFYLLIFSGVELENIADIKLSDVDFKAETVMVKNNQVRISKRTCDAILELSKMTDFSAMAGPGGERKTQIVKTGHVLERTVSSRDTLISSMIPKVSTHFRTLKDALGNPVAITLNSLMLSGVFCRMYQKESLTGEVDFSEYISLLGTAKKDEMLSNTISLATLDYETWKKTFVS